MATKEIYRETFHFAGVQGNVQSVFCFEQPSGQSGSFKDLLQANAGECCEYSYYVLRYSMVEVARTNLRLPSSDAN